MKRDPDSEIPDVPKLVLYIAPTGTGKTLSPIGLSKQYRVIFICVARHVGLALAKSAISMEKKIAFAFGCETASDIRLHYFAAASYTVNKRTGAIGKVDNSVGTKVEIMICDVKSYLTAMHYMLAFNQETDIITYWDEPTITMDYDTHELHETIHKNWKENRISKMVLSCATLPNESEIQDTIFDFRAKFENAEIHSITSYDCKKSISVLDSLGKCVLPHLLFSEYSDLMQCVEHCDNNKTMLRYFDLKEIVRYVEFVHQLNAVDTEYTIQNYFSNISEITMNSLKIYYLESLRHISPDRWNIEIYEFLKSTQTTKFTDNSPKPSSNLRRIQSVDSTSIHLSSTTLNNSTKSTSFEPSSITSPHVVNEPVPPTSSMLGILLTTRDAHTLTDGPTIFLVEDVEKVAKFYIKSSNIPTAVFNRIMEKIDMNNEIQRKMDKIARVLEDALQDGSGSIDDKDKSNPKSSKSNDKKNERRQEQDPKIVKMTQEFDQLRSSIKSVNLEEVYIPNKKRHQMIWTAQPVESAFVSDIDDETVRQIMELNVTDSMKILLLMGIGMFTNNPNVQYMEIMKGLAYQQKLYIIIASSDYVYGTNYSFCHGFIGKDMLNMTQQKIIQCMGRIGRNGIQQEYTIRFRDDALLMKLFSKPDDNMEAKNMSRLFSSD
jgi:hypothetical protein